MIGKIQISAELHFPTIAALAGNADADSRMYRDGILYVTGVTDEDLNRALEEYDHEQTMSYLAWLKQISATDTAMPRYAEDIVDVLTDEQRSALASKTRQAYENKKQLRSEKPDEPTRDSK